MIHVKTDAEGRITATNSKPSPGFDGVLDWNSLSTEEKKAVIQGRAKLAGETVEVLAGEPPSNVPSTEEREAMEAVADAVGSASPANLTKALQFIIRRFNLVG